MKRNKIITTIVAFTAMLSLLPVTACDTTDTTCDTINATLPPATEEETYYIEQVHELADEPVGEDFPEQPPAENFVQRGVWEDNIFTSEYLGLNFLLPDGWHIASDSDIADVMGVSVDFMEQTTELDIAELMDITATNTIYDMMARSIAGASILLTYERLVFPFTMISEVEYMEMTANLMVEIGINVHFDHPGTTRIGNYDWHSFGTSTDFMGMEILGRQFINIHDGFARTIIISYNDMTESVDEMLHMFFGLNDPIPQPLHAEIAEELFGSWEWDQIDSYILVFHDNGTGFRGFPDEIENFTWRIRDNDNLAIDDGASIESWTFTIDEDVLTIINNYFPGTTFSYIRIS